MESLVSSVTLLINPELRRRFAWRMCKSTGPLVTAIPLTIMLRHLPLSLITHVYVGMNMRQQHRVVRCALLRIDLLHCLQ